MDYRLTKSDGRLTLKSGILTNAAFAVPTALTVGEILTHPPLTLWTGVLLLIFLAGLSYREKWTFSAESIRYRFALYGLPLQQKTMKTSEIESIRLQTFIRGESRVAEPGRVRRWYEREQGVLKLVSSDEAEVVLMLGSNRKTVKMRERGEEMAAFLGVPFFVNPE